MCSSAKDREGEMEANQKADSNVSDVPSTQQTMEQMTEDTDVTRTQVHTGTYYMSSQFSFLSHFKFLTVRFTSSVSAFFFFLP